MLLRISVAVVAVVAVVLAPCGWAAAGFDSVAGFFAPAKGPVIVSPCQPAKPWTVAGENGALFGRQNGKFEAWQWPVKLLSNFAIRGELADYHVPIDVNALAAEIRVTPAETILTYSHAAFTIRQHMFAPRGPDSKPVGAAVVFEIESARPLDLTFSFTPEMLRMWPAPNSGRPSGEWVKEGSSGFYILHTDDEKFSGFVAMPRTQPGILVPYQEHPQTYPLELKLSFNPKRDSGQVFPLFMGVRNGSAPIEQIRAIAGSLEDLYKRTQRYYDELFAARMSAETPETHINEALAWAEAAIDQTQVKYHDEIGLVAGYYESADSARPGYAWFFGRDTMWTTYAINSYGDFPLTRRALDFLIRRQRADGKIMHEFSQSAEAVDWKATPYFYAAADSAPLFVMTLWDYVKTSGDLEYLKANWSAVKKAYDFTRSREGDDGIYNNSQGTGWVESWPTGMPKEEVYLALLDEQSCDSMAQLARLMNDSELAAAAKAKASGIRARIEPEFYDSKTKFYDFSRNGKASSDDTASIYPAVAWWDGTLALQKAAPMLTRWASHEFSADWGTRDISNQSPFYDPISYHQGSIWPLFTGWVSLAEYRAGRSLSGYAHLMQNLNLTWAQDLGSVTELLSGDFFQPLGRSSSHQLWSSAMVISPLIRGMFGLNWDVPKHILHVAPNLPADWNHARLHNVPFEDSKIDLDFDRNAGRLTVHAKASGGSAFCLVGPLPLDQTCPGSRTGIDIPLRPVELSIPGVLPEPGATTAQLKALNQEFGPHEATFEFEAQGGSAYELPLRINRSGVTAEGGTISGDKVHIAFPAGSGYVRKVLKFRW